MEFRRISSTGLMTPPIGLGCLAFTGAYGPASWADITPTIQLALDLGVALIAASDFHAGGAVEMLIGAAVAGRRDQALIATQGGSWFTQAGRVLRVDGSPAHLRRSCDASLRRLGVDHIALYMLTQVDPAVPITESVGAMADLVRAGKVGHIGLPAVPRDLLRKANAEYPVAAVAGEYSLWQRAAEREFLPAAQELAIGFLAAGPLGHGFLAGWLSSPDQLSPGDARHADPRFGAENLRRDRSLLRIAEEIAARYDIGLGRLALAWLLGRGDTIVPIPSARSRTHVEMNARSVGVRLCAEDCERLAELFAPDTAQQRA